MYEPNILHDKSAYISGGTSGINLGLAKTLARYGARVCVIGRDAAKAELAVSEIAAETGGEAIYVAVDVRDYEGIEASMHEAVRHHGPLDIVVAGAAGNFFAPAVSISAKGFKTVIDIDLLGTYHVFRAGFDVCRKPGASLIAITAGQAVKPMPCQAHVCAAKAGINALVRTLAMEWGPAGVRVNAISPGPIEGTEGLKRLAPTAAEQAEVRGRVALRRFGTPEDIGYAAIYLSCPLGAYVTGTILDVEGGFQLGDASADCLTPTR
jgi:NAD(P)-dependent dehydrogenase (short-subunit alcohol dehydrogenase family)